LHTCHSHVFLTLFVEVDLLKYMYSAFFTLIFTTWPKDRRRRVYVAPRPPGSFPERELGPTIARRSLLREISLDPVTVSLSIVKT
jgi:hypothetical protein